MTPNVKRHSDDSEIIKIFFLFAVLFYEPIFMICQLNAKWLDIHFAFAKDYQLDGVGVSRTLSKHVMLLAVVCFIDFVCAFFFVYHFFLLTCFLLRFRMSPTWHFNFFRIPQQYHTHSFFCAVYFIQFFKIVWFVVFFYS